jgi:acyl-CoA synthetase (AMP-forming)/AMP-acid ligase II
MSVDYIDLQTALQPDRLAVRDLTSGQSWSFRQLNEAAWRFARVLRGQGVIASDRIALLAKNRVSELVLHLACARLEAIFVPLNWRLSAPELKVLLEDAEPRLLIGDRHLAAAGLDGLSFDAFEAAAGGAEPLPARSYDRSQRGEVGHLYAVALAGYEIVPPVLIAFLESRLARYKIPKHVTLLEALPQNAAGKLVKAQLRLAAGANR